MWFHSLFRSATPRTSHSPRSVRSRLSVEQLDDRIVPSTFTVRNLADSGVGSLRAAITSANTTPGSDTIKFASGVRGTIALTSGELSITDNLRIDGPGANRLAVSGNDISRVFQIVSGATVSIDDLTITHGYGLLRGGGILNAGNLTISDSIVSHNQVVGLPGATMASDAFGGGILNTGNLIVRETTFVDNQSLGGAGAPGGPGSTGLGGAIMSLGSATVPASAMVTDCTFVNNQAMGGVAGVGAPFTRSGIGGAIMNDAGTFTVNRSLFHNNQAIGGTGGGSPGSFGAGGAIANLALVGNATLLVNDSLLMNNRADGGSTGNSPTSKIGRGGGIVNLVPGLASLPVSVTATTHINRSTILGNEAVGSSGLIGGIGQGGGISNENGGILTVTNSAILLNRAVGGIGSSGNGGNGQGGGIFVGPPNPFGTPNATLHGTLIALNRAEGGTSTNGGSPGLGIGGGLYVSSGSIANADFWTAILANDASTSDDDIFGILV